MQLTGPVSHPENRSPVPQSEYRRVSPGSQEEAIIPNAHPERIYNIKYYDRDYRRQQSKASAASVCMRHFSSIFLKIFYPTWSQMLLLSPRWCTGYAFGTSEA